MKSAIVAFATDTVFGLGVTCYDSLALDELYSVKVRPHHQAMQILVSDFAMAAHYVQVTQADIVDQQSRIYPAQCNAVIDARLIANGGIAVRIPQYAPLLRYIADIGTALAATSANMRGEEALLTVEQVQRVFPNIPIVVSGNCTGGTASEIWDMRTIPPKRLR